MQNKCYVPIRSIPDSNYPIHIDSERFIHDDVSQSIARNSYAFLGSTFLTNRKFILKNSAYEEGHAKEGHVLDALFSAYTYDDKRRITGSVTAICDGAGGHCGEEEQDRAIARVGHFATKYTARLMAAFQEPDELMESLRNVIQHMSDAVKRKYPRNLDGLAMFQEQTTLAAVRTFNENDRVRIIGFSIGDSMIISWHPETNRCQTLLPAHVRIFKGGQEATALVPLSYASAEIQTLNIVLDPGTIVFALTDGVYDDLPCRCEYFQDTDGQETKRTCIDEKGIEKLLSFFNAKSPVHEIVNFISKNAIDHVEARRAVAIADQQKTNVPIKKPDSDPEDETMLRSKKRFFTDQDANTQSQDIQIGDDVALYGMRLLNGHGE